MSFIPTGMSPYIIYIAPPLIGAFIGYLTNRVAIRMLFRPLKAWRILGIRIPMTPGVIPSKRHDLALNIGEMVGEHLLTSKEVGKALRKEKFQKHLYGLIKERVGAILQRDLGALPTIIPQRFMSYYDIGIKTIAYNLKSSLNNYIGSKEFENMIRHNIESNLQHFLDNDIDSVLNREGREFSYTIMQSSLKKVIDSPAMDQWVEDFVYQKISGVLKKRKSLEDVLPETLREFLITTVESQTPGLLKKFAEILRDPGIQTKIIGGIRSGVENFITSLGPMSAMVNNFISMEAVEEKVKEYFKEKEDEIAEWLQNEEVQKKISAATLDRLHHLLQTPIAEFVDANSKINVNAFSNTLSRQLVAFLREEASIAAISSMIQDNVEMYIEGGSIEISRLMADLFGVDSVEKSKKWASAEGLALLRSEKARRALGFMVEGLLSSLLQRPVGRLSNILPQGVREGLYTTLRRMASAMLATEVPGLVHSLNIRSIVAEKVDSLDLLRLEELLLSIMEEQFKYINLFGALLGFMIGCCNALLLTLS